MKRRFIIHRGLLDFPLRKVISCGVSQHEGNKFTKPEIWHFALECGHDIYIQRRDIKGKYPSERKSFRCEECGKQ